MVSASYSVNDIVAYVNVVSFLLTGGKTCHSRLDLHVKCRNFKHLINPFLTNGLAHHCHLGESTVILGASGVILNFYSIPFSLKFL